MSSISGSNFLAPTIAGVLDFTPAMLEKAFLEEGIGCNIEVCGEFCRVFAGRFLLKQRERALCCCSRRTGVRLTVLSKEDMSNTNEGHSIAVNEGEEGKIIGVHMRLARQEELAAFVETSRLSKSSCCRLNLGTRK